MSKPTERELMQKAEQTANRLADELQRIHASTQNYAVAELILGKIGDARKIRQMLYMLAKQPPLDGVYPCGENDIDYTHKPQ